MMDEKQLLTFDSLYKETQQYKIIAIVHIVDYNQNLMPNNPALGKIHVIRCYSLNPN